MCFWVGHVTPHVSTIWNAHVGFAVGTGGGRGALIVVADGGILCVDVMSPILFAFVVFFPCLLVDSCFVLPFFVCVYGVNVTAA